MVATSNLLKTVLMESIEYNHQQQICFYQHPSQKKMSIQQEINY